MKSQRNPCGPHEFYRTFGYCGQISAKNLIDIMIDIVNRAYVGSHGMPPWYIVVSTLFGFKSFGDDTCRMKIVDVSSSLVCVFAIPTHFMLMN